ncbi:efflux RND transporter periplasmic adaptor subunit [Pseudomonadota bacterium]
MLRRMHFPDRGSRWMWLALSTLLLAACDQHTPAPEARLTVALYQVGRPLVERERSFHGVVVPADLTRVAFRTAGKITHLAVEAGEQVTRGQPLAQIEDVIQRQVLADTRAQYELSQRQLARAENLHRQGALTAAQRDQLQAGFRLAQARLKLAEAALSYTVVAAPFDGTVADVEKELYEAVAPGETVVTVYRNDRTDVLVNIPDNLPAQVHQARDITTLEVRATFSGDPRTYTMHYLKGSTARNPANQSFQFWVTMPNRGALFPPGLPVTLVADLEAAGFSTETGLVVPLTALQAGPREDEFRIWRYEQGSVNPVAVWVSHLTREGALVSGELQAGDLIAVSGLYRLSPGLAVAARLPDGER